MAGSSRKDAPWFTLRQVSYLCERLLKDHEEKIREEYEQILNTKLAGTPSPCAPHERRGSNYQPDAADDHRGSNYQPGAAHDRQGSIYQPDAPDDPNLVSLRFPSRIFNLPTHFYCLKHAHYFKPTIPH